MRFESIYLEVRMIKCNLHILYVNRYGKALISMLLYLMVHTSVHANSEPFTEYSGHICIDLDKRRSKVDHFLQTYSYYDIDDVRKYCALRYNRSMLVDYPGNFCYDLYHHQLNLSIWRPDMRSIVKADIINACTE